MACRALRRSTPALPRHPPIPTPLIFPRPTPRPTPPAEPQPPPSASSPSGLGAHPPPPMPASSRSPAPNFPVSCCSLLPAIRCHSPISSAHLLAASTSSALAKPQAASSLLPAALWLLAPFMASSCFIWQRKYPARSAASAFLPVQPSYPVHACAPRGFAPCVVPFSPGRLGSQTLSPPCLSFTMPGVLAAPPSHPFPCSVLLIVDWSMHQPEMRLDQTMPCQRTSQPSYTAAIPL